VSAKPSIPKNLPPLTDLRGVLALRVSTLRVLNGWSQERLGTEARLDRTYVSSIERGEYNVTLQTVELLAGALGVMPWALLVPPHDEEIASMF